MIRMPLPRSSPWGSVGASACSVGRVACSVYSTSGSVGIVVVSVGTTLGSVGTTLGSVGTTVSSVGWVWGAVVFGGTVCIGGAGSFCPEIRTAATTAQTRTIRTTRSGSLEPPFFSFFALITVSSYGKGRPCHANGTAFWS